MDPARCRGRTGSVGGSAPRGRFSSTTRNSFPRYVPSPTYPATSPDAWESDAVRTAYNTGVFGGRDLLFLKDYAAEALRFAQANAPSMSDGLANGMAVFDQHLVYCYARAAGLEATCVAPDADVEFTGADDFHGVPTRTTFIHPLNFFKQRQRSCELLEARLRKDHPDTYYRITHLLGRGELPG